MAHSASCQGTPCWELHAPPASSIAGGGDIAPVNAKAHLCLWSPHVE